MTPPSNRPFLERLFGAPVALVKRVAVPLGLLVAVFVLGTAGYWVVGMVEGQAWSLLDCAYMTSISLTTVGYGDHLGATAFVSGKIYTMGLAVSGLGATLYSVSALTAFFLEGHFGRVFKEERMLNRIDRLTDHTLICGAGETGTHVIDEHVAVGRPFVVIDRDQARLDKVIAEHPSALVLLGDATDEAVLVRAGVERAASLVAALHDDKDNVFLVVTARYLVKGLRIVAKCLEHEAGPKLKAAGATYVVSPTYIGGMRLASQAIRPHVVDFLDGMLRGQEETRVAEVTVHAGAAIAGQTLEEADLAERIGLVVLAVREADGVAFVYAPKRSTRLVPGMVVVVVGPAECTHKLEALCAPRAVSA